MKITILAITTLASIATSLVDAGMVNDCNEAKTCAKCTESYVHIFSFREHCRWCYSSATCGGPISCPSGGATAQRDPFKCPTKASQAKGRRYTDKLGRSLYALVLAVRQKDPTECLKNSRSDVKLIKHFEVECDSAHNTCAGMLAVSEEAKALYVVYRGSTIDRQLFQEFAHGIAAQLGAWEKFIDDSGVMTYFHGAFKHLFIDGGMKDALMKLKQSHEGYRIWITGHSLGGSLASMTALYLVSNGLFPADKVKLVTFGEPRTGNFKVVLPQLMQNIRRVVVNENECIKYAKALEQHISFRYRVINKNDIVTNIPQSIDPDNLLLSVASAERQPYFYRYAVHYPDGMESRDADFEVCSTPEDHHCRSLATAIDVGDHMNYFGVRGEDYLKAGCPRSMLL